MRSLKDESGVILPMVIIFMFALTITGLAFLNMGVMEHNLAMREIYKNQAFWLAEGGIEHLLVKLHNEEKPELIPWTDFGDGDYMVKGFYTEDPLYAISIGRIIKGKQEILKRIKVVISESSVFNYVILGENGVHIGGSTLIGSIDGNRATIGTNSTSEESPYAINVIGNPPIDANVVIGPGGDTAAAINASEDVIPSENRSTLDQLKYMPDVDLPDWTDEISPTDYSVKDEEKISDIGLWDFDGNYYKAHYIHLSILATGDELVIDEDSVLVVEYLDIKAGGIYINPGKNLTIYVTQNADIGGNGIVNLNEDSTHLHIYGTDSCTSINYFGTADFHGAIYAPKAEITCSGTPYLEGSLIGYTVTTTGDVEVKWDSKLGQAGGPIFINLTNWEELP